jgi:threonine dehydrogenase-like Zn-dependent dehydrogenase
MKAVKLQAIHQLALVDIPIPPVKDDQVLIKTGASTICTSDLNDIRENPFGIALPVVIGHEGAGTVAAMGAAVKGFKVGDRVTTHSVYPCGKCPACLDGMGHLCLNMEHLGINMQGTLAEYYLARADRVRPIPAHVGFPLASLSEPVSVCLEALAQARLSPGDSLLIIGDGPFGQIINRLAPAFQLGRVVMAGWLDFRLGFATQATRLNTSQLADPLKAMQDAAPAGGYNAVIVAVGSAQAVRDGLKCLRPKGRLVLFSALTGDTPVDLFWVHLKELEIIGSCNDQDRFDDAVRLLADPRLGLAEVITHTFPIEAYHAAFDLAANGHDRALKVSFVF